MQMKRYNVSSWPVTDTGFVGVFATDISGRYLRHDGDWHSCAGKDAVFIDSFEIEALVGRSLSATEHELVEDMYRERDRLATAQQRLEAQISRIFGTASSS